MFGKRTIIAIVFALIQIAFPAVANNTEGKKIQELYQRLLKKQGLKNPLALLSLKNINPSLRTSKGYLERSMYKKFFEQARETGLKAQYRKLLTSGEGINTLIGSGFLQPQQLQIVAYMQNKYGDGEPDLYNGEYKSTTEDPRFKNYENPIIDEYALPNNQTKKITRYAFLNGLLTEIRRMESEGSSNEISKKISKLLETHLETAIQGVHPKIEHKDTWDLYGKPK